MTIAEMQGQVDRWIGQFQEGYFTAPTMILRLAEEVGELAREVNHQYGEKPKKSTEPEGSVAMELGDVLFVVVSFANMLHLDLDAVFQSVMEKYQQRDQHRWTLKDSPESQLKPEAESR